MAIFIAVLVIGTFVLLALLGLIAESQDERRAEVRRTGGTTPAPAIRRPQTSLHRSQTARKTTPFQHEEHSMNTQHTQSAGPQGSTSARRHELDARKTVRAFDFILKSLGQTPPWSTPAQRDAYAHDLTVMLQHGDLVRASLELLGADDTVVYRHRIRFGGNGGPASVDPAQGIELPLLAPGQVARHRILIGPAAHTDKYRSELRMNWTAAEPLQDRAGDRFQSEHTRQANAGRMTGEVFVADEARQAVTVLNVAAGGQFAFGRSPALAADVFLHRGQCQQALTFESGQRLSCIVIQTPRGLQGRSIRAVSQGGTANAAGSPALRP